MAYIYIVAYTPTQAKTSCVGVKGLIAHGNSKTKAVPYHPNPTVHRRGKNDYGSPMFYVETSIKPEEFALILTGCGGLLELKGVAQEIGLTR